MGSRWRQEKDLGDLVYLTSMGSPIGRYSVESDMRNITKQINDMLKTEAKYNGVQSKNFERIHPHALRHTFATRCFEKGMTPRTVQEIMGHVNYNTTVSYTHVLEDVKQSEAERVGNFLDDVQIANQSNNLDRREVEYGKIIGIL